MPEKKRVLTGIKPTGVPHIGNYLGAIRPALKLAETYEAFLFIADLHALTIAPDPAEVREQTYNVAATWLALGLDPERICFYRQSDIFEVTELAWYLSCVTPLGFLNRAHSFKDARDNQGISTDEVKHGVFSYPILMAADILLFDADVVPVGKDQKQHLEICQEAARKLNLIYGTEALKIPKALIDESVMTVPGLDGRKMSKSYDNTIPLFLPKKQLKKKLGKIVTDSTDYGAPLDPTNETVFHLHGLLATPEEVEKLKRCYASGRKDPDAGDDAFENPEDNYFGWGNAKNALLEVMERELTDARERYNALMNDRARIDAVLADGAARARKIAGPVLNRVRNAVGLPERP